jgi:hypothetical protein
MSAHPDTSVGSSSPSLRGTSVELLKLFELARLVALVPLRRGEELLEQFF